MPRIQNLIADTFGTHVGKYQGRLKVTQGGERLAQAPLSELNADAADAAATRACVLLLSECTISNEFGGEALAFNEESLALYRATGEAWGMVLAFDQLSQKYMNLHEQEKAIRLHKQCLARRRRLQDQQGIARSYNILGLMFLHIGELARSEAYLRDNLPSTAAWAIATTCRCRWPCWASICCSAGGLRSRLPRMKRAGRPTGSWADSRCRSRPM